MNVLYAKHQASMDKNASNELTHTLSLVCGVLMYTLAFYKLDSYLVNVTVKVFHLSYNLSSSSSQLLKLFYPIWKKCS